VATGFEVLGRLDLRSADLAAAAHHLGESLAEHHALGTWTNIRNCLANIAELARRRGSLAEAVRLRAAAEALGEQHGLSIPDYWARELAPPDALRAALGDGRFDAAWAVGQALSGDEAVAQAQLYLDTIRAEKTDAAAHDHHPAGLTAREREVLALLAAGQSSPAITETLVLSVHTVERHVANIFAKLGVHSRAEAAAFAAREGLV
jgi:DNA-binding CsgD family transcriptional regulator